VSVEDELVDIITNEILRRLTAKSAGHSPSSVSLESASADLTEKKPKLPFLIVGPLVSLSPQSLTYLKDNFDLIEITSLEPPKYPPAPLLATFLSLQALTRVSCGDDGCTIEGRALISALLEGRPTAVLDKGIVWRSYAQSAPKALISSYIQSENALKSFGLKFLSDFEIPDFARSVSLKPYLKSAPPLASDNLNCRAFAPNEKRVITESAVKELFPTTKAGDAVFELKKSDLLTPLAKDYLLSRKIRIIEG
jgi:ethanolamine utilization protein